MSYKLEICANSIESALAAQKGGADRIELCDNMAEGGTTPSYGLIKRCIDLLNIPVFPIIRPRGGGFVYTDEEFEVMKEEIGICKALGCKGVVLGVLDTDSCVDMERCTELITLARPMEVTFHRAFDCCNDQSGALEDIISLGCERVLTSGAETSAYEGRDKIRQLVEQADGRIIIIAGAGVNIANVVSVAKESRANECHSTAKVLKGGGGEFEIKSIISSEFYQSSSDLVEKMRKLLMKVSL